MRVFIAGATGVLGRRAVPHLASRGHEVVALSRSDANDAALRGMGATPVRADLFDAESLARAARGCEVLVRLATHISTKARPGKADWALNDRIRLEGTRAMLDAARRVGARRYVQESIAWSRAGDAVTGSAAQAERMAAEARDLEMATLRFGWLYGPETAHTRQFADMLRRRRLPVVKPGTAPLGFLHTEDAGTAIAAAVEGRETGVFDVVDERPASHAEFFDRLADVAGAPRPMRIPAWLARLGAGDYVVGFLTTPMGADPDAFRKAFGWAPRHRTLDEGLRDVAAGLA